MFAMIFDKDPDRLQDVPALLGMWIQSAGGWAMFFALMWLAFVYSRMRPLDRARIPSWKKKVFVAGMSVAIAGFVLRLAALGIAELASPSYWLQMSYLICATVGGAGALVAVGAPFVASFSSLRFRRIWALAKLSFKDAIRQRVLYAFAALLLVFLFASWFIPGKAENQVRNYVGVVYWATTILLLLVAVFVAAFSIPTDVKNQTIHTIITKPVERFEILLGRFLGFTALMTLVLLFVTTVSVIYILRGIDPEAATESLKAREPLYGELRYENTPSEREGKGTNIGREWNYRSHITASPPNQPKQFAIWDFAAPPSSLADRKQVRCEFTFDIYRTTKGYENRGVSCAFQFLTANFDKNQLDKYSQERSRRLAKGDRSDADIDNELAEEFGYYVLPAKDITDYHTQHIDVPGGLFRNALKSPSTATTAKGEPLPPLQVRVSCRSQTQYVGMAKHDFYWRLDDPYRGSEKAAFLFNFYKGSFGLWLRLCMVIGLAVALSTYLSGVISMLVAGGIYLLGFITEFIQSLGMGTAPGGGPMEALVRLANRQVALMPLEDSTSKSVATGVDVVFRWFLRLVLDVIPDVDRYDLTRYVADGFNISAFQMLFDFGALALYLLPWTVLAYYLIKWREIAAPT